jgi:cytochrome oxidase assembly protein ShyY1
MRRSSRIAIATLLMLVGLGATVALGVWQYTISHRDVIAGEILKASAVDLDSVSTLGEYVPESNYGRLVTFTGDIKCSSGFEVKPLQDIWQVCQVVLSDGTSLALVTATGNAASADQSNVSITGRIQPAQDSSQLPVGYVPAQQTSLINTDDLVIRWQSDVRDGYVVADNVLPKSQIVTPPVGIDLRNFFYAWQWWVFSGFVIFLYGRFVRDEFRTHVSQSSNE